MCGISGFLDTSRQRGRRELERLALDSVNTLQFRGPDDVGVWADEEAGIAFGHRRLSILDLSPEGHQPMSSACGRYVITFNGEIYNFRALRREMEGAGYRFRGHSDTEIMLACISEWGVRNATKRFNGMFGFAVWDRRERQLHLGRDRMGEKPLYYGWMGKTFLFGSELKALRAHPDCRADINRDALASYLRYSYVPAPHSIYKGICKVLPGHLLTVSESDVGRGVNTSPYWSVEAAVLEGVVNPFRGSEVEAVEELDHLLRDSIKMRMEADVPLGAFLSGGVDSSTVVALMQAQSPRPVQTFTVGFNESDYNEANHAKEVARHLGTNHTEIYVKPDEAIAVIPRLPTLYDEPFADSSQIPTFLISELARRDVTVTLSGDGGDELFAGYTRYFLGLWVWKQIGWLPQSLRIMISEGIKLVAPDTWARLLRPIEPMFPKNLKVQNPGQKMHRLADVLTGKGSESIFVEMISHWANPSSIVPGAVEPPTMLDNGSALKGIQGFAERMMYLDMMTYLPDDILVKVDRASMGVSLESRVPFLDHRLVEFAWRVPLSMKIRDGAGKWLLRQVLHKYVPSSLIDRPKMGFGVPIDTWLRGPLREWAEELLDEKRLKDQGFFAVEPIRERWLSHLAGESDWQYHLWDVLMFQAWLEGCRIEQRVGQA
jgi:asparagine synthase (glutamine-hydrolysing)